MAARLLKKKLWHLPLKINGEKGEKMNFRILKQNITQYGMFVALMAVMLFFTITTGGIFMTPRNLSNLFDQTGYVAVLAIGMTLILIIRQIDLSVGFVVVL